MLPARSLIFRTALRAAGVFTALATLTSAGCYFTDQGFEPRQRAFYFPTGLAVSPGGTALYVANSDFDLQYNGGTVQVLDLTKTRTILGDMLVKLRCAQQAADACAAIGVTDVSAAPTVEQVCNGFSFDQGGQLRDGESCKFAGECASGVCDDEVCAPCENGAGCAEGGICQGGACVLARNDNRILTPSACSPLSPPFVNKGETYATIGAFASGAVMAVNHGDKQCAASGARCLRDTDCGAGEACEEQPGARLFIPVRGDPSITWFNVADDRFDPSATTFDCGQSGIDQRCADEHRMGVDPYDNLRGLSLPVEPVGLGVSEDGTLLVTAHQISGTPAVGLAENDWDAKRPIFQYYTTSGVASGPTEIARVPVPELVQRTQIPDLAGGAPAIAYQPAFLVTYNASPQIDLFRYNDDRGGSPPRPFLTHAAVAGITSNADGKDSRGAAVDPSARQACEAACPADSNQLSCLRACVDIPLDLYVANRSPPSLLVGRVRTVITDSDQGGSTGSGAYDYVEIYDSISLAQNPSKVALGKVIGLDGQLHTRVFAVTFESRLIFSYDPEARRVDAVIRTGRGPHAIAFDTDDGPDPHAYLYVGHFTDSYLGVVDLDMRHPETFGIMFASIGTPTAPRESK